MILSLRHKNNHCFIEYLSQFFGITCFILIFFTASWTQVQNDVSIDCTDVESIDFDIEEILTRENRFIFGSSIDTLKALYCFSRRIENLELEAISLYKLGHQHFYAGPDKIDFQNLIQYLNKSIDISIENQFTNTFFNAQEELCTVFTSHGMLNEAFVTVKHFLERSIELGDTLRMAEGNMLLGRVLREQKKYYESDSVLNVSLGLLANSADEKRIEAFCYLHLSHLNRIQNKYEQSKEYALKGLEATENLLDQKIFLKAVLSNEFVLSKIALKELDNLEPYFDFLYEEGKSQEWVRGNYYFAKGLYHLELNEVDSTINSLLTAYELFKKSQNNSSIIESLKYVLPLLNQRGDVNNMASEIIAELLEVCKRVESQNEEDNLLKNVYFELENEKYKVSLSKARLKLSNKVIVLSLLVIILLAIIIVIGLKLLRKIKKLNHELNDNYKKLEVTNLELQKAKVDLKAELKYQLLLLSNQLESIKKVKSSLNENKTLDSGFRQNILQYLESDFSDEIIEAINFKFFELNKSFISSLSREFPNLTSNDLKLCLYITLNLSIKEIARLQYKLPESVKVARFRLRKKLNIKDKSINLVTFLNSYLTNEA